MKTINGDNYYEYLKTLYCKIYRRPRYIVLQKSSKVIIRRIVLKNGTIIESRIPK